MADQDGTEHKGGVGNWIKTHKLEAGVLAIGFVAIVLYVRSHGSSSVPAANTSNATIGTDTGAGSGSNTSSPGGQTSGGGGSPSNNSGLNADLAALTQAVDALVAQGAVPGNTTTTNNITYNLTGSGGGTTTPNQSLGAKTPATTTGSSLNITPGASSSAHQAAGAAVNQKAPFTKTSPPPPLTTKGFMGSTGSNLLANPTFTPQTHFDPTIARSGGYYYKSGGKMVPYKPGAHQIAAGVHPKLYTVS